jgi:hypothetical protein
MDWSSWAHRWDAQQQRSIPRREERFQLMLELVADLVGPAPGRILDLACGTGSISARALRRFPWAQLVALDVDPLSPTATLVSKIPVGGASFMCAPLPVARATLGQGSKIATINAASSPPVLRPNGD